jgi:hypothetical protein
MNSRFWRFLLPSLILASVILFATPRPAQAGIFDFFFNRTDTDKNTKSTVEGVARGVAGDPNLEHLTDSQLLNVQSSGVCYLTGCDSADVSTSGLDGSKAISDRWGGGAIGGFSNAIAFFYEPPATTQTFVADVLDSAHLVPRAQAQGLGFAALDPILSTWKMFRNLAYLFFVVIFLIIGLMIMFRQKMGQTAVTLQQAIPSIVVSLLFVTFSYAIAGFLIDLMYVVMYLLIGMFPSADGAKMLDYNFLTMGWNIIVGNSTSNGSLVSVYTAVNDFVKAATASVSDSTLEDAVGFLSGITMTLIIAVTIVISVFKLFFELLKTYVTIVLMIAFAPLILMLGAIPGQNVFKQWINDLVGNMAAFPATLLIIIVFKMFTETDVQAGGFLPPFLIGHGTGGAITTLVGLGIVIIMPDLIKELKKALGVKDSIFTTLGKAMITNTKDGSYVGSIPTAAVLSSAGGALKAGYNYSKDSARAGKFSVKGLGRNMLFGNDVFDDKGRRTGSENGAFSSWKNFRKGTTDTASKMSGFYNRAVDGSFKAPEVKDKKETDHDSLHKPVTPVTTAGKGGL